MYKIELKSYIFVYKNINMELVKIRNKDNNIYEIVYKKGLLFKTYHTEDIFKHYYDFRFCKNGKILHKDISIVIDKISSNLNNIGDEYLVNERKLKNKVKATKEGKLSIDTKDFFQQPEIINQIEKLRRGD